MFQKLKRKAKAVVTSKILRTPARAWLTPAVGSKVVVFTLHRVRNCDFDCGDVDLSVLEQSLRALRDFEVPIVGLDAVFDASLGRSELPPVAVCFTVDDGYWDQAEQILPILLKYSASPTLFVITGFLDEQIWPWDSRVHELFRIVDQPLVELHFGGEVRKINISDLASRRRARNDFTEQCKLLGDEQREELILALARAMGYQRAPAQPPFYRPMTWSQARRLESLGVRFGSHSTSHCVFSRAELDDAKRELETSRRRVNEELRNPSNIFAWPIGRQIDFCDRDIELSVEVGYEGSVDVFNVDNVFRPGEQLVHPPLIHRCGFPDSVDEVLRTTFELTFEGLVRRAWATLRGAH